MITKTLILFILTTLNTYAVELKSGDILLQPLHCWACNLIEAETKSEFSHIGIVTKVENGIVYVGEAFMKVREVTLKEFDSKTQKGLKLKIMRPYYTASSLSQDFDESFKGLPYGSAYL